MFDLLFLGFGEIFTVKILLVIFIGVVVGVVAGLIPGLPSPWRLC